MKPFLLLCFIPSLLAADILCPDSKTTCPESMRCCEVDGKHSCCEPEDDMPEIRMKVYPGLEIMNSAVFANASFSVNESKLHYSGCDIFSCKGGTCCGGGCCPGFGSCCGGNKCCPNLGKCCSNGCCSTLGTCCGNGCCGFNQVCCDSWCCGGGTKCGPRYKTCRNKGATLSPEIVVFLLLAASIFLSRRL